MTTQDLLAASEAVAALTDRPYPADPYPFLDQLRAAAPVYENPDGVWYASSYEASATVLRSPSFGQGPGASRLKQDPRYSTSDALQAFSTMIVFQDPPEHTRLRRIVGRAFTPRVVERLRSYVQRLVDLLLDDVGAGEFDVITDFGDHLPITVVCELLGVPAADRTPFRHWTDEVSLAVEPEVSDEKLGRADVATRAIRGYIRDLIAERRASPGEDLLSLLISAEDGELLAENELISMASLLLGAGFETTRSAIGTCMLSLLRDPSEMSRYRSMPGLDRSAIDEMLRLEPPVQTAVPRVALEDTELDGYPVPAGTVVGAVIAAANRDPAKYHDPDRLVLDRVGVPSLTFAPGVHHCLGMQLAKLELEIAVGTLVRRFPSIELAGEEPVINHICSLGPSIRGPHQLLLRV